jgi:FADH2 O2-dependent halogenase
MMYDVIVLGAGIAGSISALCLAQAGLKTLVVEKKQHPRFAIGESTIPQTTNDVRQLAARWNIPELGNISSYLGMRATGCVTYPKEVFWFGWHEEGKPLELSNELITSTALPPLGPDSHMLRADVDEYLTKLFPKYHVDYMDNTAVVEYTTHKEEVEITLKTYGKESDAAGGEPFTVKGRFVVDGTGHNCFLSRKFGLHHHNATLKHRSRTIYSHFAKPDGWDLDEILGGRSEYINTSRNNGTMHHVFAGGWIWVIPFENDTISIGLVLDLDVFPLDHSIPAQEEWDAIVNRYPVVKKHLGGLVPLRSFVRSGRIQITSSTILGDRFILSPHASSFIDPLYSTGMELTVRFVKRLVPIAQQFTREKASTERILEMLAPMETDFQKEVDQIDKIVRGSFLSTHHIAVYRQFWRVWILSVVSTAILKGDTDGPLHGAWDPGFVAATDEAYQLVEAFSDKVRQTATEHGVGADKHFRYVVDEAEAIAVATKIKEIIDKRFDVFHKQILFDIMPPSSVIPQMPLTLAGGIASEYAADLLTGRYRWRIFSFFGAIFAVVKVTFLAKIGPKFGYKYGEDVAHLFDNYHVGKYALRASPIQIAQRIWMRIRGQKLGAM